MKSAGSEGAMPNHKRRRCGAVAVETAIVFPVLVFLLVLLIVGGMSVFRYQQTACLAREAARWASVHGSGWQQDTGQTSQTVADIRKNAVLPLAVGMDTQNLSVRVQWVNGATGQVVEWDSSSKAPTSQSSGGNTVANTVRVTVTYQWAPGLLIGSQNLQSVSEVPMSF
jgi:Flp pilus assembly protein TadG